MTSAIEKLRLSVEKSKTPDDIIMGIFSTLGKNNISRDPGVLHNALYDLRVEHLETGYEKFSVNEQYVLRKMGDDLLSILEK